MLAGPVSSDDGLRRCMSALAGTLAKRIGAEVNWSLELPQMFTDNGCSDLLLSCTPGLVGAGQNAGDLIRLTLNKLRPILAELIASRDIDEAIRLIEDPDAARVAVILVGVIGKKSARAESRTGRHEEE
jgi:hypothetical protein